MPLLRRSLCVALLALACAASALAAPMHRILLLTGQSNPYHDWLKSYPLVKAHLERTGLFKVDVAITPGRGADFSGFAPRFADYKAVVMVYEGDEWPDATKAAFAA